MEFLPDFKICFKCKQEKSKNEFDLYPSRPDGLHAWCVQCRRKYQRENNRKNTILYRHGITVAQYELMLKSQNGVCAICGQSETAVSYEKIQSLSIDHNHKTLKTRGLLCDRCNKGLGYFRDNPEFLEKAAQYLRDHTR